MRNTAKKLFSSNNLVKIWYEGYDSLIKQGESVF